MPTSSNVSTTPNDLNGNQNNLESIRRIYYGAFIHSLSLSTIEYIQNGLMAVSEAGVISWFEKEIPSDSVDRIVREKGWHGAEIVMVKRGEFIIPG